MNRDWILQTRENQRVFANATWVPLRAAQDDVQGKAKARINEVGYVCEFFGCGSVAFPPQYREIAEKLSWGDIGLGHSAQPYAYKDGYYSPIDKYQYNDKEPIGVELVFVHDQPVENWRHYSLKLIDAYTFNYAYEGNRATGRELGP